MRMLNHKYSWILEDEPNTEYKETVKLNHVYLLLGPNLYPVPDFYKLYDKENLELKEVTVYLNENDELHIDEISSDFVIKDPCKEDAEHPGFVFRWLKESLKKYGLNLYEDDIEQISDACVRVIAKRFGKEEK